MADSFDTADLNRPILTLTLSVHEAMSVTHALRMLAYAAEGDLDSVAVYVDGAPLLEQPDELDRLAMTLDDQLAPFFRDTRAILEAKAEQHRQESEAEAAEWDDED